jgi:peptidoglycan hydrolase-like protein with peptidoglycan-binding domain
MIRHAIRRVALGAAVLSLAMAGAAYAQSGTPAGSTPATPSQMGTTGAGSTASPQAELNDPGYIRDAQRQLQAAGFNPGGVTGTLDDGTREALRQFQQSKGLNVTGQLDSATQAALGVASGTGSPGKVGSGADSSGSGGTSGSGTK